MYVSLVVYGVNAAADTPLVPLEIRGLEHSNNMIPKSKIIKTGKLVCSSPIIVVWYYDLLRSLTGSNLAQMCWL